MVVESRKNFRKIPFSGKTKNRRTPILIGCKWLVQRGRIGKESANAPILYGRQNSEFRKNPVFSGFVRRRLRYSRLGNLSYVEVQMAASWRAL